MTSIPPSSSPFSQENAPKHIKPILSITGRKTEKNCQLSCELRNPQKSKVAFGKRDRVLAFPFLLLFLRVIFMSICTFFAS